MLLTKPLLTKSELLEVAGITSTTFNNWRLRGLIPLSVLGCEKLSITRFKYSYLVAAYCASLSHHTGPNRREFVKLLKETFSGIAKDGFYESDSLIAISANGKGSDCGYFSNTGYALQYGGDQTLKVNIGETLSRAEEMAKAKDLAFYTKNYGFFI